MLMAAQPSLTALLSPLQQPTQESVVTVMQKRGRIDMMRPDAATATTAALGKHHSWRLTGLFLICFCCPGTILKWLH